MRLNKLVRPLLATVALAAALWLVFHDRSVAAEPAAAHAAHAATPGSDRLSPRAPSRTPARTAGPAWSRS